MEGDTFKVGDQVIVRDWEELASEYGTEGDGRIAPYTVNPDGSKNYLVSYFFMPAMREMSGTVHTIIENEYGNSLFLDGEQPGRTFGYWNFEPWMLRHVDESVVESVEVPDEDFMAMLVGT